EDENEDEDEDEDKNEDEDEDEDEDENGYIDEEIEVIIEKLDTLILNVDEEFSSEDYFATIILVINDFKNEIEDMGDADEGYEDDIADEENDDTEEDEHEGINETEDTDEVDEEDEIKVGDDAEEVRRDYIIMSTHEILIKIDYILQQKAFDVEDFMEFFEDIIELENIITSEIASSDVIQINILSIANNFLLKSGEIVFDDENIGREGGNAYVFVELSSIEAQIDEIKERKMEFESKLQGLSGETSSDLVTGLTIVLDVSNPDITTRKIEMCAEVIEKLKVDDIETITFDLGYNSISLDQQSLGALSNAIVVTTTIIEEDFEVATDIQTFEELEQLEIKILVDGEYVTNFDEPIEMKFDVSSLGVENMNPEELKALTVFRLDEETLEWKPVGGWFDPMTKTVRVFRLDLSKYSVMVSNKSFSNIDNSQVENEINALLGKGITENEEIDLSKEISRGEFTAWLLRAYGLTNNNAVEAFGDVSDDNVFFAEINTAFQIGLVKGKGGGVFDANAKLTQLEMEILVERVSSLYGKLNDSVVAGDIEMAEKHASDNGILSFLNTAVFGVESEQSTGTLGLITKAQAASTIFGLGTSR
ncbi:MAG: S-layer homology domain-containing protein, partial [Clostridiales bacterium]|nr:S-layer homology domain-containing protein [Clostridiales bacterium]